MSTPTTIAIIDDQLVIVELLAEFLMDEGYQVYTSSDPVAGLTHLRKSPPQLLILDLMMPVLSGWDIFDALRSGEGATTTLPIILMTAAPRQAMIEYQKRDQRYSTLMPKPLGLDELLVNIERMLEARATSGGAPEGNPGEDVIASEPPLNPMAGHGNTPAHDARGNWLRPNTGDRSWSFAS